ncbi:MAG: RpiB/LacA/LacB family sugar-phosphate isomerase [Chloroflexota bacterium]
MKISVGSDERPNVVDTVLQYLEEDGHDVLCHAPKTGETLPWPRVAQQVAEDVVQGRAEEGILFCWTGTGVSIAANKVPGVRAALCVDAETARGARLWNNANVLCLSLRLTTEALVKEILEAWLNTHYQPNPEDDACLAQVEALDIHRR